VIDSLEPILVDVGDMIRASCDRVVQGALKLILEPIFEADFHRRHDWPSPVEAESGRQTKGDG
jgi:hypothetical protein